MPRWSKLPSALYQVISPDIRFQLQCRLVRMTSADGGTDLPRYWITLGKETIWSYPGQSVITDGGATQVARARIAPYPYDTDVSEISNLIREYIDTPVSGLLTRQFANDCWGLIDILRAADRRIGQRRLPILRSAIHNVAALKILDARQTNSPHRSG
jgi:hypothetical protein